MASFAYTNFKTILGQGAVDLREAGNDIRCLLVMTNTTADTEEDVATISAFTTLDEYDGANYARKTLGSQTMLADNANNRGEFDFADFTWTALGAGTRQAQAAIFYKHVTNDTDSIPLYFVDSGGFPFAGNGGDVTYTVNAEGSLQIT